MNLVAIGNYYGAHRPFQQLFQNTTVIKDMDYQVQPDDVILFGGGEDISPSLYGQRPSRYCHASTELSFRDKLEKHYFESAVKVGAKMIGICRGAQLLCALSGGSLIQHVTNHGVEHHMVTADGREMFISSVHHQMMVPFKTQHELIGWAKESLSNKYIIEGDVEAQMQLEPEVVFFPHTKALAIQYHPEFMSDNEEAVDYARQLVTKYLLER